MANQAPINVVSIRPQLIAQRSSTSQKDIRGNGDGGGGGMEINERVAKLEATFPLLATKTDVAETKALISETKAEMIKWIVGTALAVFAIGVSVLLFAINRIAPPVNSTSSAPAIQPIIIQTPSPLAAYPSPPQNSIKSK